jgi:hypothetical protein
LIGVRDGHADYGVTVVEFEAVWFVVVVIVTVAVFGSVAVT